MKEETSPTQKKRFVAIKSYLCMYGENYKLRRRKKTKNCEGKKYEMYVGEKIWGLFISHFQNCVCVLRFSMEESFAQVIMINCNILEMVCPHFSLFW